MALANRAERLKNVQCTFLANEPASGKMNGRLTKDMLQNKSKIIQSKSCDGKVRHKSRLAADHVLSGMKLSNDKNRPLEVYYCIFCKNYHIGHGPKPKNNKLPPPLGEGIGGEAK